MEKKKQSPEYRKEYYEKNKERIGTLRRERYLKDRDKIKSKMTEEERISKIEYLREYRRKNKESIAVKRKEKYSENREEQVARCRRYRKRNRTELNKSSVDWYHRNKDVVSIKRKAKYKSDKEAGISYSAMYYHKHKHEPGFKIKAFLRHSIQNITRIAKFKVGAAPYVYKKLDDNDVRDIVGCSVDEFICHIESMFTETMTWYNHGEWHLDHIFPISKCVELYGPSESFYLVNHYTNLQPLWAMDNFSKGNKI